MIDFENRPPRIYPEIHFWDTESELTPYFVIFYE
jgi:hypothetical protein